jgi:hypothetical protein
MATRNEADPENRAGGGVRHVIMVVMTWFETPRTKTNIVKNKRKRHDSQFKARVALEALKGLKTMQQIARGFGIHP